MTRVWKGMSLDENSKAVVACNKEKYGCVLWAVGAYLRIEMEEAGLHDLSDLGLDNAPCGISVWEGKYVAWNPSVWGYPDDAGYEPRGTFRSPTEEEWQEIRAGRCPWKESYVEIEGESEI